MSYNPLLLTIIDGFGFSQDKKGNAIAMAKKPNLDFFEKNYPHTLLQASGTAVGLEWGEPGNSEVGHLAIGGGRYFKHYLPIINSAINSGNFFSNEILLKAVQNAKARNSKLHIVGLLTSGSVHANFKHLSALIDFVKKQEVKDVYLHLFTDGKDSGVKESRQLLSKLQSEIKGMENIKIATIMGRDFAMNRTNDWQKTNQAHDLIVNGTGSETEDFQKTLEGYHSQGITDELISPTVLAGLPKPLVSAGDSLVFFNFREDSMKQLAKSFADAEDLFVVSFTKYFEDSKINHIFEPIKMDRGLAEWLSLKGKKQLHIAESEKYAHVTYFFNGLENRVYDGETDLFLESPKELAKAPEMRSMDIAQKVVEELKREHYDFFVINFANADLLSHLGNIDLVVKGIEKVDGAIGLIFEEIKRLGGTMVVTSDHGNAESLVYSITGERETKHNLNPVPFFLISPSFQGRPLDKLSKNEISGVLPDIAPTILEIMGLDVPSEMDGSSLLKQTKFKVESGK